MLFHTKPRRPFRTTLVRHVEFRTYRMRSFPSIRVPKSRFFQPLIVMPDNTTTTITRETAARILRYARLDDRRRVNAARTA